MPLMRLDTVLLLITPFLMAAGPPAGPLCPPRVQLRHPELCQDVGPGSAVVDLAQRGLYPVMPLPTVDLDPSLFYVPLTYVRAGNDPVRLYSSAGDALGGGGEVDRIPEGFVYLYYADAVEDGDETAYATSRGYVSSDDVNDFDPPNFHGQAFERTPQRPFGWVISGSFSSAEPDGLLTEHWLSKFDVVQIFDVQRVGEWDWYQIGRNEWIEQRNVARVVPDSTPPPGVDGDKWITVNLYEQTVSAYDQGRLVYATMVSTGRNGFWTKPGLFEVWAKLERDLMTGGIPGEEGFYYLESVPWVLYFDKARALHGTYWHAKFGTTTSRGCVNLPMTDAQWFFNFAEEGTQVYVFDPSGNTPTDASAYGEGGA
jgi:hypothetical protein